MSGHMPELPATPVPLARRIATLPRRALMVLVRGYQLLLSPWIGGECRFEPTCSAYTMQALERHGALAGSYLGVARIVRCGPWCAGGCDPVPVPAPRLFTHLKKISP